MKIPRLYTVKTAAARLGCSAKTIHRITEKLGMTPARIGTRGLLIFSESDLERIRKGKAA